MNYHKKLFGVYLLDFVVSNFDLMHLGYGNRYRMQQLQQEDWIKQQIKEKSLYKENARQCAETQDDLARHYNDVLTANQDKYAANLKAVFVATQQANLQMA
jgi:hypothetical protein